MNKKDRQIVLEKFYNHCAYCGEILILLADVRKYLKDKNATGDLFSGEERSCMSFYGLCE